MKDLLPNKECTNCWGRGTVNKVLVEKGYTLDDRGKKVWQTVKQPCGCIKLRTVRPKKEAVVED